MAIYTAQAGSTPVQTYANNLYQGYVAFFNQNLGVELDFVSRFPDASTPITVTKRPHSRWRTLKRMRPGPRAT